MNTDSMANFEAAHLEQWLETSRRYLLTWENPRLCRGDSNSLTFPGVHRGHSAT